MNHNEVINTYHQLQKGLLMGMGLIAATACTNKGNVKSTLSEKPNILFIAVDDLRPELGCFGNNIVKSPNIDRLASQSVIFSRAYCNVPVSGASRASLLTGTRPTSYRFISFDTWADKDNPEAVTLPEYFRRNGYHTVSLSKVFHHQYDSRNGWDVEWRPSGKGSWRNYLTEENLKIDTLIKRGMPFECADVPDTSYFDGQTALKAIKHLREFRDSDKPFFLAVGFLKPHLPFNAPKKYWDMYDPAVIGVADNPSPPQDAPRQAIHQWGELRNYFSIPEKGPLTDSAANRLRHGYYACVSYTDALIGMVLDELRNSGLEENTIVVLWGDHGWNLGEHGMWCKHCNFNTSLNAPLMISVPGLTKGDECNSITEYIDIYPTLCDLTGLPLPSHLEGESLTKRLIKPGRTEDDFAVCKFNTGVTIIKKDLFYTEWLNKKDSTLARMLYDHASDPDENINLSETAVHSTTVENLSSLLREKRGQAFYK
ncbi:MAG: sulfatase [Bacteroidales bacterium]|nr:sulfatase [Bacteroidales bacterium]MBN2632323.1 sulfatase [Bacteroidales bacterium]